MQLGFAYIPQSDLHHSGHAQRPDYTIFADSRANELMRDYKEKSVLKRGNYPRGMITWHEFYPRYSKQIIDRIDDLLGIIYGLTLDEVDYIKNYDIEFRADEEE